YIYLNRLSQATEVVERAVAHKFDSPSLHAVMFRIAVLQRNEAEMKKQLEWLSGRDPVMAFGLQADRAARAGHLRDARAFTAKSADGAARAGQKEAAALAWLSLAEAETAFGASGDAHSDVRTATELSTDRDVVRQAA